MDVRLKRAYDPASPSDGYRVLIDRLWPRGVSKQKAKLDEWEKELAPSTELREWFGHEPSRFAEFRRRYISELRQIAGLSLVESDRNSPLLSDFRQWHDCNHFHRAVFDQLVAPGVAKLLRE